jgi:trafficking protein particle complex subunit 8
LLASTALANLSSQSTDPLASEQLAALKFAIRWESGISSQEFINQPLEGDKWLVQAAGKVRSAKAPPSDIW